MFNPAVAGCDTSTILNASYRQLWSGFNDAPKDELITLNTPFTNKIGLGTKLYKLTTGPLSKTSIEATYSYRVPINYKDFKLSMGLSILLYDYSIDKNKITLKDMNDEALIKSSNSLIVPDANFGTYMYNNDVYFGFAIHQLFNRRVSMINRDNLLQRQVRHYFFNAGYKYSINKEFDLEPSVLLKLIEAGIFQADFNLLCTYKKSISLGLAYRTGKVVILMINVENKKLSIGYSYDLTFSTINKYSAGSHEIRITYKLKPISFYKKTTFLI
jgi:type IX secretion system PorP/SprF family membrane protein